MSDQKQASRREFIAVSAATTAGVVYGCGQANASPKKTELSTAIEIPTGFRTLDSLTGGLHRSELAVLASPPRIGKTSLALNIADHVAVEARVPTLYVTLQASQTAIAQRLLCARGKVTHRAMRDRTLSDDDRHRLMQAGAELSGSPFYVDDKRRRNVAGILGLATSLNAKLRSHSRVGLIVVDCIQLLWTDSRIRSRNEQLREFAQDLKRVAVRLDAAILCLWQLNRQPTATGENRSPQGNLRAVEQAADIVLLLHREKDYLPAGALKQRDIDRKAQLAVVRPTDLAAKEVALSWQPDCLRFVDLGSRRDPS